MTWGMLIVGLLLWLGACDQAGSQPSGGRAGKIVFETVTPTLIPTSSPTARPIPKIIQIPAPGQASHPASAESDLPSQLIEALNQTRHEAGLTFYQIDPRLTKLAQAHADDMGRRGYFDHVSPEGLSFSDRLAEVGLASVYRSENIYLSVKPADQVVADTLTWWLNDPPHRENLLHPELTHAGAGLAQTPEGWYVVVIDLTGQ